MGGIDVLVNNAAYDYRAEIGALDVERMKTMFDTNVFGLVDITNRVVPQMKERKSGDIDQHRVDVGHEGRRGGDPVCGEQVGSTRHLAVLAGGVAPARHPRDLGLSLRSADELRRQGRTQQPEQALRHRHRRTRSSRRWACLVVSCGRSSRCLPAIPGRKTDEGRKSLQIRGLA